MSVRVRFAPSPTGHLHVGNVRTALFNWLFARQQEGTFLLRIEDTDRERSLAEFEEQLKQDLLWLGLDWDEGVDQGGNLGPYRQTDRLDIYAHYAAGLLESGAAYPCFCSRRKLENVRRDQLTGEPPHYPGTCRDLSPAEVALRKERGQPAVLRFRVRPGTIGFRDLVFGELQVDCKELGDFILLRSDGVPQYNFAVVVDDLCMEISHAIRGEGHIGNTYRQLLIYEALQAAPPHFAHLSTILGPDGGKLSKRHGAKSIRALRSEGYLPGALLNYLALLGWTPEEGHEILQPLDLARHFRLEKVHRSPALFDEEKLNWVNRSHLKACEPGTLVDTVLPFLCAQGWVPEDPDAATRAWLETLSSSLLKYLQTGRDIVAAAGFLFQPSPTLSEEAAELLQDPVSQSVIRAFRDALGPEGAPVDSDLFRQALADVKQTTGAKGKALFHPLRLALTSQLAGPDLASAVDLMERGRSLELPTPVAGAVERVQGMVDRLP